MDKSAFILAFNQATARCRDFAQQYLVEKLPPTVKFDFVTYDHTPKHKGLIKYLGGRLFTPQELLGVEAALARRYLWVDGKIPHWINLSVHAADADFTFIEVEASVRITADDQKLYYTRDGIKTPFQVLGPRLPPGWVSLEKSGKFSVAWWSAK